MQQGNEQSMFLSMLRTLYKISISLTTKIAEQLLSKIAFPLYLSLAELISTQNCTFSSHPLLYKKLTKTSAASQHYVQWIFSFAFDLLRFCCGLFKESWFFIKVSLDKIFLKCLLLSLSLSIATTEHVQNQILEIGHPFQQRPSERDSIWYILNAIVIC